VQNADNGISHHSMDNQAPKSVHLTANRNIKDAFLEIDSNVATDLRKRDDGYAVLFKESNSLQTISRHYGCA
jgi:hypothetical protein